METLASLCKRRGFIFQSSEIYGGINGFWDYGPLGCELKRNVREAWWKNIVQHRENIVGLDASIIMHPKVWEASGHVGGFADPMVDCKSCKKRYKGDNLCEEQGKKLIKTEKGFALPEGIKCTSCGSKDLTEPRSFNLMFKTFVGPVEDESAIAYLRPETAQGIFAQFGNVLATSRQKVPFGIAQIGKAFRNEINPRNYTFRSREFEQMELEFFVKPGSDQQWHDYWVEERMKWYQSIGLPAESLNKYVYKKEELAHYASACVDIMYDFPFGMQELEGIAARGDFDLGRHQQFSGKSMEYFNQETNERFVPHVVEPSAGVDRIVLALLCNAYCEEWIGKEDQVMPAEPGKQPPEGFEARTVMRFHPKIAPVKVAVFPLLKNKPELMEKARGVFDTLQKWFPSFWDVSGAIGRRYRRQDEIGTPFCVTIDFDTLTNNTVTIRERDSMKQERIEIAKLTEKIHETLA
ncbi:MAG: glycine--tRNA ligase [Lentisphaerae bacterium RIFOXYA12_FULL_48_11]|nr:MAG: glycine--tRNA ligase [Lentisphaerae bacterium RIFOXYA12_FULL_48_11]